MPNSQQHRDKANHNRAFLNTIDVQQYPDWAAVVAFYTAVHLVERLRTRMSLQYGQHSTDHQDRLGFVQGHHRPIHTPYFHLYNAGFIARYETVHSFNTKFSAADVQTVLIDQHLVAIEQHVASAFAPPPAPGSPGVAASGS
jgi:hypothetical protein